MVGMHFATADIDFADQDGIIWKVNYHDSYRQLPKKMKDCLDDVGGNVLTLEMLQSLQLDLDTFDLLSKEEFFVFFEPPSTDARIVNQHALFSIASGAEVHLDQLLSNSDIDCEAIVIPKEIKWEIRDKLDQSNITERVLFPGLDGLSAWLKRHYSPKILDDN